MVFKTTAIGRSAILPHWSGDDTSKAEQLSTKEEERRDTHKPPLCCTVTNEKNNTFFSSSFFLLFSRVDTQAKFHTYPVVTPKKSLHGHNAGIQTLERN